MNNENLILIYRDLNAAGGAPSDLRNFVSQLSRGKNLKSISWGQNSNAAEYKNVHREKFHQIFYYLLNHNFKTEDKFIIVGGLIFSNIFLVILLIIRGLKFDYMPLSQWTHWSLSKKIFYQFPEIKYLKSNNLVHSGVLRKFKWKIKTRVIVLLKSMFFKTSKYFFKKADNYWVSSSWEANQICVALDVEHCKCRFYKFGCDLKLKQFPLDTYYHKFNDYTNIVYWGRVDYENKGLDRLVNFASHARSRLMQNKVLFHIIGPSYNDGKNILDREIEQKKLHKLFEIASDEIVHNLGIEGLANADAAILFTRFEINARVIREANYFQVPMIATNESHILENGGAKSKLIDFSDLADAEKMFFEFLDNIVSKDDNKSIDLNESWSILEENDLLISPVREVHT